MTSSPGLTHPRARIAEAARLGAPFVWAMVIFAGSSVPGSNVPGHFGALAHFTEYAVLGALITAAETRRGAAGRVLLATGAASAYGVTDELHQAFVPLRMTDPADWSMDTLGALAGSLALVLAIWCVSRYRSARRPERPRPTAAL